MGLTELTSKCGLGPLCSFLQDPGDNPFVQSSQLQRQPLLHGLLPLILFSQPERAASSDIRRPLRLLPPSLSCKDPCEQIELTQISRITTPSKGCPSSNLNSICILTPLCDIINSQVLEIRTSLGRAYSGLPHQ